MADVIDEIKTELGGTSTLSDEQLKLWVADAQWLIDKRVEKLSAKLSPDDYKMLTRLAVVGHARNPSGTTQITAAVDDGSVSRRLEGGAGRVSIGDDLWDMFGLDEPDLSDGWAGSIPYSGSWR